MKSYEFALYGIHFFWKLEPKIYCLKPHTKLLVCNNFQRKSNCSFVAINHNVTSTYEQYVCMYVCRGTISNCNVPASDSVSRRHWNLFACFGNMLLRDTSPSVFVGSHSTLYLEMVYSTLQCWPKVP